MKYVFWKPKDKKRQHKIENTVDQENDDFTSIFKIKNAKLNDGGFYKCTFSNDLGVEGREIEVIIETKPKELIVTSKVKDKKGLTKVNDLVEIKEFKDVTLNCVARAHPVPIISWIKDGKKIKEKSLLVLSQDEMQNHEGTYQCKVENKLGLTSRKFQVKVKIAPIAAGNKTRIVVLSEGEKVSLNCEIIGFPLPKLSWKFNSKPINSVGSVKLSKDDKLLEFGSKADNFGTYSCIGENYLGKTSVTFNVFVKGKKI